MLEINCPKACGKCCEVIVLSFPKKEFHKKEDHKLLTKIWHRINRKKAESIIPDIKTTPKGYYFYECNQFNPSTRECMIYDKRPRACKYYPFYGNPTVNASALMKDCYWANQIMKKVDKPQRKC